MGNGPGKEYKILLKLRVETLFICTCSSKSPILFVQCFLPNTPVCHLETVVPYLHTLLLGVIYLMA